MADQSLLSNLIKRLEAATSKLEDIALGKNNSGASAPVVAQEGASEADSNSPALRAFDDIIFSSLKTFVDNSKNIDGLVKEQSDAVEQIFQAQRKLISIATQAQKPDVTSSVYAELLKPTQQALEKITEIREKNRASPFFNHLSTVGEGIPALGWVAVEPAPAPYVGEMKDSAVFYANRVMKEFKDKDRKHIVWANSFISLLGDLQVYVKEHHTTGLVWNPKGQDAKVFLNDNAPPAPAGGAIPPPPPPPPADFQAPPKQSAPDMTNLFNDLNKGEGITSGLKKVSKDQMTHKNPELRSGGVVAPSAPKPSAAPTPVTKAPKKVAKFELEGNKWVVENQINNQELIIEHTETRQSVYIYGCEGSTIQVKGKVNAIILDTCKKTGVVFDSTVSTIDIVNSKSVQVQVLGVTPTIVIDKTDGAQLFLSKECLGVDVFTAKSSEVNISIPSADGDFVEKPVPEQFKSKIVDGLVVTEAVEHASA
ncbi:suppressor of rasval19 [Basidiobolus ranarum]|uniref:Adenylyl cyclase-associated protein n=1 Tax=Basidiobolus ranarum TaxID=34480 RepID=A0ABR2W300_9FUNG